MQIEVRTSINVRSNTVPSTPALVHDALPESWDSHKLIEKPTADMPTLVPRLDAVPARLKASQRPRRHSRLSSFLHGFSVIGGEESNPAPPRPRKMYHYSTQCYARTPRRIRSQRDANITGLRPANSTRGVIDPVHSPTSATWPLTPHIQDQRERDRRRLTVHAHESRVLTDMGYLQTGPRHRRTGTRGSQKEDGKSLMSHRKDPKVRKKIIGCLFFGTLLTIVLTTYLALATSNSLRGATFHGVFIFFILLLTIVFSHYLIRLCMLSFRPQRRFGKPRDRMQWPTDEEAVGFAQPPTPIPVTFARDEELGSPEGSLEGHESDAELLEEKVLPPPPPVYGNWRSSVRADPNLIHWHPTGQSSVQQEARELIFAGSGHRPPSYVSEEVQVVGEWQPATGPPLPLFAERRRAATVDYMREARR
ncbi:hypothetical protein P7C71_g2057, partial [Lecanoromycetidae sp. Uapishka_2]